MYKFYNWRMLSPGSDAGGSSAEDTTSAATNEGPDEGEEEAAAEEEAKPVTMTQEEFDTKFDQAYARGYRKGSKESKKPGQPDAKPSNEPADDTAAAKTAAQAITQAANRKLAAATVLTQGAEMDITPKGLKLAAKLLDLDDCLDANGDVDEAAVRDELEQFKKDYPEFDAKADKRPALRQFEGNPKGGGAKMTKEEIMKIKDPAQRRKAIAENIALFK